MKIVGDLSRYFWSTIHKIWLERNWEAAGVEPQNALKRLIDVPVFPVKGW